MYRRHVRLKRPTWSKNRGVVWKDSIVSEPGPRYVQTYPGRTLDRLRKITEELSRLYRWDQPQAVWFVLTGEVPHVSAIKWDIRPHVSLPLCSRILLEIDPTSTPQDVAEAYRSVRSQEFGRLRRLSLKHLHLAVFTGRHVTFGPFWKEDWKARLEDWNQQCKKERRPKEWRFKFPSQFERDCRLAFRRLFDIGTWGQEEISMPKAQRDSLYSG